MDLLWYCSIALEAVAMIPQLYIVYRAKLDVHDSVKRYVWLMWVYGAM